MSFSYANTTIEVDPVVAGSHREVWAQLGRSGTWWTAAQMQAIAERARADFARRNEPPWNRKLSTDPGCLPPGALAAIDKIATSASSIDGAWAQARVEELGEGHYVELAAVTATVTMLDMFALAAGVDPEPLPAIADDPGQPTQDYPDGLGDIGAHVRMLEPFPYANVARALSLVPSANILFRTSSVPLYSAPGMGDLVWDTPLARPQVELVASRVAALNECFY